ncbi:MAG: hypothetical protein HFE51_10495 [Clostridia bacterium]|nr:hypothetical protein [Clostridia bacterium]MCI8980002.1 hypothetical protein [Clostridia bacterium]MCI9086824.1 hypothetical protein [Clostridia bacterium]
MKKKILKVMEIYCPISIGIICFIISVFTIGKINVNVCTDTFDKVLDSVINFTSIIIGFIGVLIGILFSIRNSKLVKRLFKHKSREKLKQYFIESFVSGAFLIVLSIIMYLRQNLIFGEYDLYTIIFNLWIGFTVYTALSSYRIISIMIVIVFNEEEEEDNKPKELPQPRKTELETKYERQINI